MSYAHWQLTQLALLGVIPVAFRPAFSHALVGDFAEERVEEISSGIDANKPCRKLNRLGEAS
jgi:hypothetical protein